MSHIVTNPILLQADSEASVQTGLACDLVGIFTAAQFCQTYGLVSFFYLRFMNGCFFHCFYSETLAMTRNCLNKVKLCKIKPTAIVVIF